MKRMVSLILLAALLLGLPLAGVMLAGHDVSAYLEFPPRTQPMEQAPFSWAVFIGLTIFVLATVLPFLIRIAKSFSAIPRVRAVRSFPWWGWAGLLFGVIAWVLAWTRFEWAAPFQRHTFTPPWIAFIIVVNALTYRRTGRCLLTHQTAYLLKLFPLSAAFWWFFEYLNRFVQNWYYTACGDLSGIEYFFAATLPFATVLPAVLSTEEFLATYPRVTAGLERFLPIRSTYPWKVAVLTLIGSAAGLFFVGWFPNQLFPLLWVAPLLLIMSFQSLEKAVSERPTFFQCLEPGGSGGPPLPPELKKQKDGRRTCFAEVEHGDWRRIFRFCLAALICGFFWEMWNFYSLSKWIYTVPYVNRFHLFEMPLLGYTGYLPFGIECAVVAAWLGRKERNNL